MVPRSPIRGHRFGVGNGVVRLIVGNDDEQVGLVSPPLIAWASDSPAAAAAAPPRAKISPVHARSSHACTIRHHERRDSEDELRLLRSLIHPSAWKENSTNFACTEFSRVALRVDLFLYYRLRWLRGGYRVFV